MSQYGRQKLRLAGEAIANHGHSTVFSSMVITNWFDFYAHFNENETGACQVASCYQQS